MCTFVGYVADPRVYTVGGSNTWVLAMFKRMYLSRFAQGVISRSFTDIRFVFEVISVTNKQLRAQCHSHLNS